MRVTLVVHQFPPNYFTGTEQYVLAVGRELQRRGHDVDVFALDPAFGEATGPWRETREVVEGLPVRRINFWMNLGRDWRRMEYRHPYMAEVFGAHLRERDSDVVHCFHLRHVGADLIDRVVEQGRQLCISLMDFWFLCPRVILMRSDDSACDGPPDGGRGCLPCHAPELWAELQASAVGEEILGLEAVASGVSKPGWDLRSRVASLLERPEYLRQRLAMADAVIAPTAFLREVFVKNGAPAERLHHRAYGVDTGALADEVRALRDAAGAATRPLTFGFFGTFSAHKGPHVLVEAMRHVRGDCRALLRGRQSDFADYSGALVHQAAVDPRIRIDGPFDRASLAAALASIDVLIVPSTWHENAPFVVLEARAAGLPVLASRFGGLVEVVRDEHDGELFAAGDAEDLGRRLQRLVDEPARLQTYRANVAPPKTLAQAVDEFELLYREAGPR
ncbi:MAG: glycosyltransferase [Planctomycetes bacterium]|nr:glycosyltransferase [Planctomycetota bacterium]